MRTLLLLVVIQASSVSIAQAQRQSTTAIRVVRASYGQSCGVAAGNVTAQIARRCNGRAECAYRIDHTVIGDPAVGCRKDYVVEYTCAGSTTVQRAAAPPEASGETVQLSCAAPLPSGGITVQSASYGQSCGQPAGNVTAQIARSCNGRPDCDYRIDHTVIGDPAVGCRKDYVVEYTCAGSTVVQRASAPPEASGRTVQLRCAPRTPSGVGITVRSASYGPSCGVAAGNVTQPVAAACNGRARCDFAVRHQVLGDPSSGCPKDFVVEWDCAGGPSRRLTISPEAGLGSTALLNCD